MEFRKQTHAVYYTRYHIVVSTKYRRKILRGGVGEYLKKIAFQITRYHPEIEIIEINTDVDYMHVLISIPPKMSVSEVVRMLKANTGKKLREKFPHLDKVYWGIEGIWSIGYFVSTVGVDEKVIQNYIEHQGQGDSGQAKLEL